MSGGVCVIRFSGVLAEALPGAGSARVLTGIPRVLFMQMAAASVDGGAALLRAEADYLEVVNRSNSKPVPAGIYITGQVVYHVS